MNQLQLSVCDPFTVLNVPYLNICKVTTLWLTWLQRSWRFVENSCEIVFKTHTLVHTRTLKKPKTDKQNKKWLLRAPTSDFNPLNMELFKL